MLLAGAAFGNTLLLQSGHAHFAFALEFGNNMFKLHKAPSPLFQGLGARLLVGVQALQFLSHRCRPLARLIQPRGFGFTFAQAASVSFPQLIGASRCLLALALQCLQFFVQPRAYRAQALDLRGKGLTPDLHFAQQLAAREQQQAAAGDAASTGNA
ncbi:MAG: hypothetical protein L0H29_06990 [Sinobacteraceae bacterium]|nr:hypothetical protein [Nevskiaceae bacterium]